MPWHQLIFPNIALCHPSYLSPSSSSLPIPLPLKPEGLSRSTQITSLWLCICFQSCAINQASLGMFPSFSSSSSIFLPPCPFLLLCLSLSFSGHGLMEDGHSLSVTQIKTTYNLVMCLFPFLGGSLDNNPHLLAHRSLQDETAARETPQSELKREKKAQ